MTDESFEKFKSLVQQFKNPRLKSPRRNRDLILGSSKKSETDQGKHTGPYPTKKPSALESKKQGLQDLPPLQDILAHNLDGKLNSEILDLFNLQFSNPAVLFCGINPGITSSQAGHHFARKNNHFYHCLVGSGLTNGKMVTFEDDIHLPREFNYGITNLVNRVTRGSDDLDQKEMIQGIPWLLEKVKEYRPRYLCFIGKCVFDAFMRYHGQDPNLKKYGLQSIMIPWTNHSTATTKVFSIMSTSGRVATKPEERMNLFRELKILLDKDRNDSAKGQH